MHYLMVPGINGSDAEHWQTIWAAELAGTATRIDPTSWDHPELDDWCNAIDVAVEEHDRSDVVLVAHSLGCVVAGYWLARRSGRARGVFLVSPPDTAGPDFPRDHAATFTRLISEPVGIPGVVVFSEDDPYCQTGVAKRLAAGWRLPWISAGQVGHINSASRLGRWDFGRDLLTAFSAGTGCRVDR